MVDGFLIHDRPIQRHADDSIAWVVSGTPRLLRRARGYAPLPVLLKDEIPSILAVGPHLKNTVSLSVGRQAFISQHIGDLETPEAFEAFEWVISDFLRLYEVIPQAIAHDLHPDYVSTRWAVEQDRFSVPLIGVQHHHAHLAACLAENQAEGPALGDRVGWHRLRDGWFDLGRRVFAWRRKRLRTRRHPAAVRAARAAMRQSMSHGGSLWRCSTSSMATRLLEPTVAAMRHFGGC